MFFGEEELKNVNLRGNSGLENVFQQSILQSDCFQSQRSLKKCHNRQIQALGYCPLSFTPRTLKLQLHRNNSYKKQDYTIQLSPSLIIHSILSVSASAAKLRGSA